MNALVPSLREGAARFGDWCAAHPELVTNNDPKSCWKPFHDAFLAFGGPPVPLVRGAMMKEAPKAVF